MKDNIHKKNSKKGEGCVEVEVNYNGEDNLKETTTNSQSTRYQLHKKMRYLITFNLNKVAITRMLQSGGCRKIRIVQFFNKYS